MQDSFITPALRFAIKFPFQSKNWVGRFVIGVALLLASMMIPFIPAVFVYGYIVEVMRLSIKGELTELPEWNDWGKYGMDGLRSLAVGAVYMGPGFLITVFGWLAYFIMYFSGMALMTSSPRGDIPGPGIALMIGAMAIMFLSMFFGWLASLAGAIPLPVAMAHFIAKDKISAAFHLRELNKILSADKWGYFIGWLLMLGLFGVAYFAFFLMYMTIILCFLAFIVIIPISFYVLLVSSVIFGQLYSESVARLDSQSPAQAGEAAELI